MNDKFTLIENEKLSEEDFVSFINLVSNDFVPPLLSRIDVHKYFSKINTYGRCVQCRCEGKLIGLIIFYCNNFDTDKAFVTFLAVLPEYRGMKVSSILINKVCTCARDNNKIILAIETNNEHAKDCYLHLDFLIINKQELPNYTRYYMEKVL